MGASHSPDVLGAFGRQHQKAQIGARIAPGTSNYLTGGPGTLQSPPNPTISGAGSVRAALCR
jgi:hypothetical protein